MRCIAGSSLRHRWESRDRVPVSQNPNVQSADAPRRMIRTWNSAIVRSVREIWNIAWIICIRINTWPKKNWKILNRTKRWIVFLAGDLNRLDEAYKRGYKWFTDGKNLDKWQNMRRNDRMKKTKIVCTMGPNTDNREIMKELALNGMDVARFNFPHDRHAKS